MNQVAIALTRACWAFGLRVYVGMSPRRRSTWVETPVSYLYPVDLPASSGARIRQVLGILPELEHNLQRKTGKPLRLSFNGRPPYIELHKTKPEPLGLPRDVLERVPDGCGVVGKSFGLAETVVQGIRLSDPETAHVLFAGTTGSGKTVAMQAFLTSLSYSTPNARFYFVDLKNRGLADLADLPQVAAFASAPEEAARIVKFVRDEVDRRVQSRDTETRVVLAIDELAEFAAAGIRETFEQNFPTIARLGRELNVHLVATAQKPEASQLGGQLLQQFGARVVGRLRTARESSEILGRSDTGAEFLPGKGAMLYIKGGDDPIRVQAFLPDLPKVKQMVPHRRVDPLLLEPEVVDSRPKVMGKFPVDDDVQKLRDVYRQFLQPDGSLRRGARSRMASALGSDYGGSTITRIDKAIQVLSRETIA